MTSLLLSYEMMLTDEAQNGEQLVGQDHSDTYSDDRFVPVGCTTEF